jgi:hypothetical protein
VIAIARNLSLKYGELRATTSLARLLATHGRRDEARTMLAKIYGWFTEGFDTLALTEAKALLYELNQEPPALTNLTETRLVLGVVIREFNEAIHSAPLPGPSTLLARWIGLGAFVR